MPNRKAKSKKMARKKKREDIKVWKRKQKLLKKKNRDSVSSKSYT
jgi:hypothetical protein